MVRSYEIKCGRFTELAHAPREELQHSDRGSREQEHRHSGGDRDDVMGTVLNEDVHRGILAHRSNHGN